MRAAACPGRLSGAGADRLPRCVLPPVRRRRAGAVHSVTLCRQRSSERTLGSMGICAQQRGAFQCNAERAQGWLGICAQQPAGPLPTLGYLTQTRAVSVSRGRCGVGRPCGCCPCSSSPWRPSGRFRRSHRRFHSSSSVLTISIAMAWAAEINLLNTMQQTHYT